jgi:ABC-type oligopeptide transport system, periplasmic component
MRVTVISDRSVHKCLLPALHLWSAHFRIDFPCLLPSLALVSLCALLAACAAPWNNPYPQEETHENILYEAFRERPKHLDPAQSYSANEVVFTGQIYEPPLQYHYLKRPYTLVPLTATEVPQPVYLNASGHVLPTDAAPEDIAFSRYDIRIKPEIHYQPHPAFARDEAQGTFLYHPLSSETLKAIDTLADFPHTGTRELSAEDYVYQIKRLAHPALHSPIFGMMSDYIVGLKAYRATLAQVYQNAGGERAYLDLRRYPLEGAEVVDRLTFRLTLRGKYPQLLYWLAMPFFAPIPWEADRFYTQPGLREKNITLDWYPVGTGPYMLTVNNPNRKMVMVRNPNFHGERYPVEGELGDPEAGLLKDAGIPIPFIDKVVFSLEKENIPYWNKFLQGYYDVSSITSDSFDQAIQIGSGGGVDLTEAMKEKDIRLSTSVATTTFYMGFNMLDPMVGGVSERARKLRQAIAIAVDYEEYLVIFLNGRGIAAQGPLPPGIFGFRDGQRGINPYVYDWVDGAPRRKSMDAARRLLAQAGYPEGRDAATGKPLLLYFDVTAVGRIPRRSLTGGASNCVNSI